MTIKIIEKQSDEINFPKLMIHENNGRIILFLKRGVGVVLDKGNDIIQTGFYSTSWSKKCYIDYNGPLTIQNKH